MTHPKRKAPKIKWSLFASFTAVTAIILILLAALHLLFLNVVYGWTMRSQMKSLAYEIGYLKDHESFAEEAKTLAQNATTAMSVYLLDTSSETVIAETTDHNGVSHLFDSADIRMIYERTQDGGGFLQEKLGDVLGESSFTATQKKSRLISAFITQRANGDTLLILLDTAVFPLQSLIASIQNQLTFVSLIMFAIAAGIAFLLARHIASPIERISAKARKMSKGAYDIDYSEKSYREIEELSEVLNQTSCELSKVDRLQKELIANISHDLRTPLTMIVGYAEVMRDIEGENTPENMQVIIDEATRLSALVNDLLEISRIQGGDITCKKAHFDLAFLAEKTVERYRRLKENSGFLFLFNSKGKGMVFADEAKIMQVLCNLLNNAINYSESNKEISVRVIGQENAVRLEVEDHGIGIPPEHLENVWDRYYRVDKNHRRSTVGSGLGLSIVREVLDLHGARYGVSSKVGEGTTFWFELPLEEVILYPEQV